MAVPLGKRIEWSRWGLVADKSGFKVLSSPLASCVTPGKLNPQPQFPCSYNGNDCRLALCQAVVRANGHTACGVVLMLALGMSLAAGVRTVINDNNNVSTVSASNISVCIYWTIVQYWGCVSAGLLLQGFGMRRLV